MPGLSAGFFEGGHPRDQAEEARRMLDFNAKATPQRGWAKNDPFFSLWLGQLMRSHGCHSAAQASVEHAHLEAAFRQ